MKVVSEESMQATKEHIKLFLSLVLRFSIVTSAEDSTSVPRPFVGGNFLGLLNLIKQMRVHGSCRNIWDGDSEKLIQSIKGYLSNRRRGIGCFKSRMESAPHDSSLDTMMSNLGDSYKQHLECEDPFAEQKSRSGTSTQIYSSLQDARDSVGGNELSCGNGLSGVFRQAANELEFYVAVKLQNGIELAAEDSPVGLHLLDFNDLEGVEFNGSHACPISINDFPMKLTGKSNLGQMDQFLCVCPTKPEKGNYVGGDRAVQSLVTDDWKERDKHGDVILSRVDPDLLSRTQTYWSNRSTQTFPTQE